MTALDVRAPAPPAVRTDDPTVAGPLLVHWSWWRSRGARARLHTRPLLMPALSGTLRPPGIGVDTVLVEAPDPYARPCGLVLVRDTGHVSVVLAVDPPSPDDPGWLQDVGAWLALLDHEPDVAGCAVVLPGADLPGADLPGSERPLHPPVLVQVTWRLAAFATGGDQAAAAVEVLARVPRLVHGLGQAAVGAARPVPAAELAGFVRRAYDGGRAARTWSDAGPGHAEQTWDRFRHGAAVSRTWSLNRVPPAAVLSGVAALRATVPGAVPTRVTLLALPGTDGGATPAPARLTSLVTVTAAARQGTLPAVTTVLDGLPAPLRPWLRPCYGVQAAAFAAGLPSGVLLGEHAAPPALLSGSDPDADKNRAPDVAPPASGAVLLSTRGRLLTAPGPPSDAGPQTRPGLLAPSGSGPAPLRGLRRPVHPVAGLGRLEPVQQRSVGVDADPRTEPQEAR
jgi:hypothetical protein